MKPLLATLELYRTSAMAALNSLPKSAPAIFSLFAASIALGVGSILLSPLGIAGGFVLGFFHAALVGSYLSLVEQGLNHKKPLKWSSLQAHFGDYLWEVISILFVFWIGSLILGLSGSNEILLLATFVATLIFNPAPEQLYIDRTQGTQLLQDSVNFMNRNWPEWLGAHLPVLFFFSFFISDFNDLPSLLSMLQVFGPWFGFITSGATAFSLAGHSAFGVLLGGLFLVFVHFFMLFRGHLYKQLSRSSRRGRQWRSQIKR